MKRRVAFLILTVWAVSLNPIHTAAQEVLSLEEAIKIGLEKNYSIKLVSNNLEIDRNNINLANAGMIPAVTGNLTNNNAIQNSSQTRATGEVTERKGARNSNLGYGVGLNWTIFDGFGMFARYEQLKELSKLGEANLQIQVISTVADITNVYYNLVQQQYQLKAFRSAIDISRYRVTTAQSRFQIGKAARLEVLNALVDLNTDTTNLLRQQELYRNTQINLNEILAREVSTVFKVVDTITIDRTLTLAQLSGLAQDQNPSLRAALVSRRIAELDLKQVRANRFPAIDVNTGYNFSRSESALGFATLNTGRGFNYGLSASVNIFNGFLQRRREQNAGTLINNAQIDFERVNHSVKAQLAAAYQTYQTNLSLVGLEENNQKIAKQNLDITLDKFRLGSITQIEVREAQLNYINAQVRFSNAQYQAKLAEIALKEITGSINLIF
jgi:outer membrane protein